MTTANINPEIAAEMGHLERFQSALEDQMQRTGTGLFSATDETETINVTLNGKLCMVGLYIDESVMRLGPKTLEQRINEALLLAQAAATEAAVAQYAQLCSSLGEIAQSLLKTVEPS